MTSKLGCSNSRVSRAFLQNLLEQQGAFDHDPLARIQPLGNDRSAGVFAADDDFVTGVTAGRLFNKDAMFIGAEKYGAGGNFCAAFGFENEFGFDKHFGLEEAMRVGQGTASFQSARRRVEAVGEDIDAAGESVVRQTGAVNC